MTRNGSELPNTLIGFSPVAQHSLNKAFYNLPNFLHLIKRSREIKIVLINDIEQIANRVILFLIVGSITHSHGSRVFVSSQMMKHLLCQFLLSSNAVHDLEVIVTRLQNLCYKLNKSFGSIAMSHI